MTLFFALTGLIHLKHQLPFTFTTNYLKHSEFRVQRIVIRKSLIFA